MKKSQRNQRGKEAFLNYYQTLFADLEDFEIFLRDLKTPTKPILRFHPNHEQELKKLWQNHGLSWQTLDWYSYAVHWPPEASLRSSLPGHEDHLIFAMNASSLLPILALDLQPSDTVLDACAAPGGKALAIVDQLQDYRQLVVNDISFPRIARMKQLFKNYGYLDIEIWKHPAQTLFRDLPTLFDKILVDAPCSSEKYVWLSSVHLKEWSLKRIKKNALRQMDLLSGLWLLLKPGGRMVYATCAITPEENEAVIARFLKKKPEAMLANWTLDTPGAPGFSGNYLVNFDLNKVRRIKPDSQYDPMSVAIFEKKTEPILQSNGVF